MADNARRAVVSVLGGMLATVLALAVGTPAALADPDDTYPSQAEVDAAEEDVADKAAAVASIKAQLLMANRRLEDAATRAERAAEEYNGAMWRLDKAKAALEQARADAAEARRTVAGQRDAIGALAARTYRQGAELSALSAVFSAEGPESLLGQYAAYQGASSSMDADWQRFAAADALARVFERKAADAKAEREAAADEARVAKQRAAGAAREAQQAADRIAGEKDRLIRRLAEAQDISVALARKRQAALEEQARQRAIERAQAEARAQAKAEAKARAEAEAAAERERKRREREERERREKEQRAEERAQDRADRGDRGDRGGREEPEPVPEPPAPAPPPPPPAAPSPRGGAQQAIAFAKAQVGEPYRWGAAGPNAWDCSGLTLGAWGSAGVSLPHYSVAQYHAGTPISAGDLRPGDLVFWSSSRSPGGIHHVALYIGDGMIVHAPRTGRPVAVESMYYWIPPTHFARL